MHRTCLLWWIVVIRDDVAAQCLARDALELVTVADSAPPGLCALGSSAVRHGYRLTILGANRSAYHDLLESKPRMLLDFLRRDASLNNVVAFVDGISFSLSATALDTIAVAFCDKKLNAFETAVVAFFIVWFSFIFDTTSLLVFFTTSPAALVSVARTSLTREVRRLHPTKKASESRKPLLAGIIIAIDAL